MIILLYTTGNIKINIFFITLHVLRGFHELSVLAQPSGTGSDACREEVVEFSFII